MWCRGKVWGVGFEHYSREWDCLAEDFGQGGFLECKDSADSEFEVGEAEQLLCFFDGAAEAVEYSAEVVGSVALHDFDELAVGIAGVYHEWLVVLYCPADLLFEGIGLLHGVGVVPVEVESHFAYGYVSIGVLVESLVYLVELLLVVVADFLGVEAYHGV